MSIVRLRTRECTERVCTERYGHAEELAKARASLRGIYARFTEGFVCPDLQEAAELIGPGAKHAADDRT
jgi:hypothetical protein